MFEIGNLCSKSGDFEISYAKTGRCGPLDNDDMTTDGQTDYFSPCCACARGVMIFFFFRRGALRGARAVMGI